MAGLEAKTSSQSEVDGGSYASDATHQRLFNLAWAILDTGYTVIVDATFLRRRQHQRFGARANAHQLPFAILCVVAPQALLCERIARREQEGMDVPEANLASLDHQLAVQEPFAPDE